MGGPVMNRLIDWAAMHDHEVHGQPGKHEKLSAGNQSEQKKRTVLDQVPSNGVHQGESACLGVVHTQAYEAFADGRLRFRGLVCLGDPTQKQQEGSARLRTKLGLLGLRPVMTTAHTSTSTLNSTTIAIESMKRAK